MTVQIIYPADRGAWLAARNLDITASTASALLGVSPWVSAYQLWAEKTGRLSEQSVTDAMQRGLDFEEVVVKRLRRERPDWEIEYRADNTYFRDPNARIGATPDTFATRPDRYGQGTVQLKTKSSHSFRREWIDHDTGEVIVPVDTAIQTIIEAHLTGSVWAAVAVLVVDPYDFHVLDVPLHARIYQRIKAKVAEFWALVDSGKEPDPDWSRDGAAVLDVYRESQPERRDLTGDPDINATVERYLDAKATATAATRILDDLRPRIVRALGTAEVGETSRWEISARTTTRTGPLGQAVQSRTLRIKPRQETPHAERF